MSNKKVNLYNRFNRIHKQDTVPVRPFQRMVYELILAVELNQIAHKGRKFNTQYVRNKCFEEKTEHMLNAYNIAQRCRFKRVGICIDDDPVMKDLCIMRFRFSKLYGVYPYISIRHRHGMKQPVQIHQRYNHIVVSLHIPKDLVETKNLPRNSKGGIHGNSRQRSDWSCEVLAKHYGLEFRKF